MSDRVPEVGQEIEAYCTSCKMDLNHVVVAKLENVVKKVVCKTCSKEHLFRPAKAKVRAAARRKRVAKSRTTKIRPEDLLSETPKPYTVAGIYEEGDVLTHPKFGLGQVSTRIGRNKIEVSFEDGNRLLICNKG